MECKGGGGTEEARSSREGEGRNLGGGRWEVAGVDRSRGRKELTGSRGGGRGPGRPAQPSRARCPGELGSQIPAPKPPGRRRGGSRRRGAGGGQRLAGRGPSAGRSPPELRKAGVAAAHPSPGERPGSGRDDPSQAAPTFPVPRAPSPRAVRSSPGKCKPSFPRAASLASKSTRSSEKENS